MVDSICRSGAHAIVRLRKSAVVVVEDTDRAPFAGQNQLGKAVAIEIAPDRTADQASFLEGSCVFQIYLPTARAMTINS